MDDILTKIKKWNKERLLHKVPFDHTREASFIIEELLESTGTYDSVTARTLAENYAKEIISTSAESKEAILDSFADIVVFAVGTMVKLGYDPAKVMEEVFKEIDSRKGTVINGKFVKDPNAKRYTADFSQCIERED
ncbi:MAG: hypothetical protein PHC89_01165 [Candidatus Pacebacteria bacterium]|nr:hypothetical protein [Candidatus Paceibacterota bacterium]